jgi:hypothetical protein
VWFTDIGHHMVLKFDFEGRLLLLLGRKGQTGDGPDQFARPPDVAVAVSVGRANGIRVLGNKATGLTLSVWYQPSPMIELEPIGPRERLKPGKSVSFTEDWWLLSHPFPKPGQRLDLMALAEQVSKQTTVTKYSRG